MMYRLLNRLALAFASAGLTIATVLTIAHASDAPLPCGGSNGCDRVAHDPSSFFMGHPVSAYGIVAYVILVIAAVLRIAGVAIRWSSFVGLMVSLMGSVLSAFLTYYSITKIHATCLWCLGSGAMMVLSAVAYIATSNASWGAKDGGKPVSGVPWALVPILAVSAIAVFGGVSRPKPPDLSAIDLRKVSYSELANSSHAIGAAAARVTIVEFGDLMCPACREMHLRLVMFLIHNKGRVRLMFHHFPLVGFEGHEQSVYAAELSEQLSDDDFWEFLSKVYAMEEKPSRTDLDKIFGSLHRKRVRTPQAAHDEVLRDMKIGRDIGVKQTPTYILFIDGKPDAKASSFDIAKVIKQPEFKKIFTAPREKGK
jgi:uncharacterized membrane protein/protein-disulfide isomerase